MASGIGPVLNGEAAVLTEDFQIPLNSVSIPTLVLAPDFTMIAANDARLLVTGTTREETLGRNLFEFFPDNPDDPAAQGVRNLKASLDRVLRDKVADRMAAQKYDIPIPNSVPVQFEERYWSPINIPVLNAAGDVTHILHQVEEVTAAIKSEDKQVAMASEIYRRTEEVRSANVELKLAKEDLERKVVERTVQLQESESRLVEATASAEVGIWEMDAKTGKAWRSASHDRLFGLKDPLPDWTLETFLSFVHPDDRSRVKKELTLDNETWRTEFRIIRTDGALRWMAARGQVFYDEKGEPIGARGINLDITERKDAEINTEIEKQKFEAVFKESPAAMALMKGADFVFEKVNPRYIELSGRRELMGLRFNDAFSELQDQEFPELLKNVYETGKPFIGHEIYAQFVRKEGGPKEESYWDIAYIRVLDSQGQPYGIYNHAYDVTDRVLSRLKLQETQGELIQAKDAAEAASRMKSAFLANMSHEIRTPLGAIMGFSDLLGDRNLDPNERESFAEAIKVNGRALTKLIDDILDLAKVEAGRLEVDAVDFSIYQVMADAIELFRENARKKNIYLLLNIEEGTPTYVCSDPSRLRQILVNLIGNAIKFTHEGGVRVNVTSTPPKNGKLELVVDIKDSGIGLTKEQSERLFLPFVQADNTTTRNYGGTGLGLALSKRLAEALGGSIAVSQSSPGKGCTFTLTFVASETRASHPAKKSATVAEAELITDLGATPLKDFRILAVDDSPENLFLVQRLLIKYGAVVDTSDNGEEAVEKSLTGHYDLILMDIQMPKMDGYQSKKALEDSGFHEPIVALTAHAMTDERTKTTDAGFSAHLTKPLDKHQLVETVGRLVRERRQSRTHH